MNSLSNRSGINVRESMGFTLIELLVVVSILGVLSSIAAPRFVEMKTRASITCTKQTLSSLADASQLFDLDRGYYPASQYYDSRRDLQVLCSKNTYISNVDIPDPFQKTYDDVSLETDSYANQSLAGTLDRELHGFIYVNYSDFLGDEFSRYHGIGLYSIGPDSQDSWLSLYPLPPNTQNLIRRKLYSVYAESSFQPVLIYNPSNGTYSDGDFGAFRGELDGFVPTDL